MSESTIRNFAFCGPLTLRIADASRAYLRPAKLVVDYSRDLGMPSDETLDRVSNLIAQDQFETFESI